MAGSLCRAAVSHRARAVFRDLLMRALEM